jgi:hypothetical protein
MIGDLVRRGRVAERVVELGVDLLMVYRYVCTRLIESKILYSRSKHTV